ncbi:tetratricopeptide repeat protein [Oryzomonas rubra]|uniref:Tetratricopeptide repeat protein n=1 Tax=Oryzomonas rubra TaxID=2509454 RepID=A0A5A9XLB1_9BACT|nr:tetratricopeptide repeat protein [Oryzomonas rubra]
MKFCRNILFRFFLVVAIISTLIVPPGFCQETEDSQIFMSGFNAYQQKNYPAAIKRMNEVLQKYPDSPLRDMAIFWLSRSYYKNGNLQDAARNMSRFAKEYPDNPLRATVEDELLALTARYDKGETIAAGEAPAKQAQAPQVKPVVAPPVRQQAEQEQPAQVQAAKAELAKQQTEKERIAKQQADQERQAAEKAEQERLAQEQAAKAGLAKQQAEQERLAKQQADQERQAAEKVEQERLAKEQAAKAELAKQQAEQQRLAKLKAEQERLTAEKAEQERLAKEQAAKAEIAKQQAEQERLAKLKVEQERLVAEKAEQERLAKEQAAKAELAKQQAGMERLAKQKADQERMAIEKAEEEKLAQEKNVQAQAVQEKQVAEQAEIMRLAREKAEQKRQAILKAEEESKTAEQAAQQRQAAVQAERERLAVKKAGEERAAAEAGAAQQQAAARAEEQRQTQTRQAEEKARAEKALLREKAIAQYKSIIETYPGSSAAVTAAAKLKGLGVAVALPPQAAAVERQENAQVLKFEVGQYVGFEFNLLAQPKAYEVAHRASIPFEVINRGNGSDSFVLESAFPAEFKAEFAAAGAPEKGIRETPKLAPGEVFRGVVSFEIPAASIDGLKITHPVKAASTLMAEASQSREVAMTASAPLLRAVLKADKTHLLPGGQVVYRIVVLNIGTMAAKDVTLNLNYPPQLEPLDYSATGFKQGMKSVMVTDGLQIKSGESREFSVAFRLKDDSLAGQELITRAELVNNPLQTTAVFVSNLASVDPQHGIKVHTASERLVVIPGQTTTIPFVVANTGNVSEKYRITSNLKSAPDMVIYHDINRDGIRQANEPAITEIGPLAPKEEAAIIVEVKTPRSIGDGTEDSVQLTFTPEGDAARPAVASARLFYSRPVLKLAIAARDGRLKPGEVASFDLVITNGGSNLARIVELQSSWPEQLELVGADPANSSAANGNILWKFKELGAGEKKAIKVSFRVKHGIGVGTNIQVKNIMTYEDQLGNRY